MSEYDVMVVGGRIAGAAAATLLAQRGARVLVLERGLDAAPVSVPVVFANAMAIIEKMGARPAVEAAGGSRMYAGAAKVGATELHVRVRPYAGVDYHLGLRREVLDRVLLEHAAAQPGVEVRLGFNVTGVVEEDGRVVGVRGRQSGGPETELRAPLVVGADGAHSQVARAVKPRSYRRRRGQNCVYYAYYRNFGSRGEAMTYSYRGDGYAVLTFDADDGLTALSLGARPAAWPAFKADAAGEFERRWRAIPELAELGRHAERATPVRGHGPRDSYYRQPYGSGWALVGDAGYLKDPCTGQGIYDALRSAELLAEGWAAWRAGEQWATAMRRYQRARDRETKMMYELTFMSSKIPRKAQPNVVERLFFDALARDQDYASGLAGIYNGGSPLELYTGPRGALRMLARLALRPLALQWAVAQ